MKKKYGCDENMENEKIRYHFNDRIKAPCKDCKERYLNCHDKCEKYKAYRLELEKAKEAYNKSINSELNAMFMERAYKKPNRKARHLKEFIR